MKVPVLSVAVVLAALAASCGNEPAVKAAGDAAIVLRCPDPAGAYAPHDLIPLHADVHGLAAPVVDFRVNGAVVARDTTPPFEAIWRATDLGSMHIEALARSANGGDAVRSTGVDITIAPLDLIFQELTLDDIGADLKTGKEPSVVLTAPAHGTVYCHPAPIPLIATVTSGAPISRVEFEVSGRAVASVTRAPFEFTWTPPSPGRYAIAARATDAQNRVGVARVLILVTRGSDELKRP